MSSGEESSSAPTAFSSTEPITKGPKRQHYLPKFYLEGFTRDEMLAVYDRELDTTRIQKPINTGVIGHFYTFEDSEGRKRFEIEAFLSDYESKAKGVIENLERRTPISLDERTDLSIFIALGGCRTPDMIDSIKSMQDKFFQKMAALEFSDPKQLMESMRGKPWAPESEEELEAEALEMVNLVQTGQIEVSTDHQWAVGAAIKMALSIAPILSQRNWIVIHREDERRSFVTTDSPVLLTNTKPRENSFWGVGYGSPDALVAFPLTQSCALIMHKSNGTLEHKNAPMDQIRKLNLALANQCQRFVIARDEDLVKSLAKHGNLGKRAWSPKIKTSA